jgi:hypothetical protein
MRAQHSHAIRPAERDSGLPADSLDLGLQATPVFSALGKPAIIDYRGRRATLSGGAQRLQDTRVTDTKHRDIRRLRQFRDAAVALAAGHGRVVRVDGKYAAGKLELVE